MIFYTLQGPGFKLEIHDDKMKLLNQIWWPFFFRKGLTTEWEIDNLTHFGITDPKFILWGKIEWKSFNGESGSLRFTTNSQMMGKIEKFMQKKILKNLQRTQSLEKSA